MHTGVNVYSSIGVCLGEWDLVLLSFLPDDLAIPFWDMSEVDRGMRNGKTWEVVRGSGMGVECWGGGGKWGGLLPALFWAWDALGCGAVAMERLTTRTRGLYFWG